MVAFGGGCGAGDFRTAFDADETMLSESLAGEKVRLRRLESGDLEFLYLWENNPAVWRYGECGADISAGDSGDGISGDVFRERFSRDELREFIENQQHDIFTTGQLRFAICRREPSAAREEVASDAFDAPVRSGSPAAADETVGFIDIFEFDPLRLRAGVGILICEAARRGKGYGREALELVSKYAREVLGLCELWCDVAADNDASLALFSRAGFVRTAESAGMDRKSGASGRSNVIGLRKML